MRTSVGNVCIAKNQQYNIPQLMLGNLGVDMWTLEEAISVPCQKDESRLPKMQHKIYLGLVSFLLKILFQRERVRECKHERGKELREKQTPR